MAAKKRTRLDEFHDSFRDKEGTIRNTLRLAKELSALKDEEWRSQYAHPELMEEAELRAEQVKDAQTKPKEDD